MMILHSRGGIQSPTGIFGWFHFGSLSFLRLPVSFFSSRFLSVFIAVAPMHSFYFLAVSRCQPHQTRRMKIEAGDRLIGFLVAERRSLPSFFAPRTSTRLSDPQFCENATSTAIACPQRKSGAKNASGG